SALLAFGAGELAEEVFVDATEYILRTICFVTEADLRNQVNQFAELLLIERGPRVVLRKHALERRIVALDGDHRVVDEFADGWLLCLALQISPTRFLRHP